MTEAYKKAYIPPVVENNLPFSLDTPPLERVLYIYELIWLKKNWAELKTLVDFSNEVNTMTPAYIDRLSLQIWPTIIKTQMIDNFTLQIFKIVLANFQVKDKFGRA